jgi:DNA-binding NarL/FixJ family response regulator
MTATTVALLDDHEIVLEGLKRTLERAGFDVVAACSGVQEFIDRVRSTCPQLCIIDLRLAAGTSGIAAIRSVLEASPRSRIAILTSSEDGGLAASAIRAGATGFIIKDVSTDALTERLKAVANGDLTVDSRVAEAVLNPVPKKVLTTQEVALLRLVADGLTNKQIATRLGLSAHTIKEYLAKSMRKLGTQSRAETVARAMSDGLL